MGHFVVSHPWPRTSNTSAIRCSRQCLRILLGKVPKESSTSSWSWRSGACSKSLSPFTLAQSQFACAGKAVRIVSFLVLYLSLVRHASCTVSANRPAWPGCTSFRSVHSWLPPLDHHKLRPSERVIFMSYFLYTSYLGNFLVYDAIRACLILLAF